MILAAEFHNCILIHFNQFILSNSFNMKTVAAVLAVAAVSSGAQAMTWSGFKAVYGVKFSSPEEEAARYVLHSEVKSCQRAAVTLESRPQPVLETSTSCARFLGLLAGMGARRTSRGVCCCCSSGGGEALAI